MISKKGKYRFVQSFLDIDGYKSDHSQILNNQHTRFLNTLTEYVLSFGRNHILHTIILQHNIINLTTL